MIDTKNYLSPILALIVTMAIIMVPVGDIPSLQTPIISDMYFGPDGIQDFDEIQDISTFTNTEFLFVAMPGSVYQMYNSSNANNYRLRTYYNMLSSKMAFLDIYNYQDGNELDATLLKGYAVNDNTGEIIEIEDMYLVEDEILNAYDHLRIDFRETTIPGNRNYTVLGGTVHIKANLPITVLQNSNTAPIDNNDLSERHGIAYRSQDDVWSAFGSRIYCKVQGDLWISSFKKGTKVNITDIGEYDDNLQLELDVFDSYIHIRHPEFDNNGFDNDTILIEANNPVSIVAGYVDDNVYSQVYGWDQKWFLTPVFQNLVVQALEDTKIEITDLNGGEGSFDGKMKKGEIRVFDFSVKFNRYYYASYDMAQIIADKPIQVFTYSDDLYLSDNKNADGSTILTRNVKLSQYNSGVFQYPLSENWEFPVNGEGAMVLMNAEDYPIDIKIETNDTQKKYHIEPKGFLVKSFYEFFEEFDTWDVMNLKISGNGQTSVMIYYDSSATYSEAMHIIPGITLPEKIIKGEISNFSVLAPIFGYMIIGITLIYSTSGKKVLNIF